MTDSQGILPLNSQKPYIQFIVSMLMLLLVSVVLLGVTLLLGRIIFGQGVQDINFDLESISKSQRGYLKFTQAFQHISIFLAPALVTGYLMTGNAAGYLKLRTLPSWPSFLFVFFLALVIIPLVGDLGVWNSRLSLPGWLSGIESWMLEKESEAGILTGWLIFSESPGGLVINIIVLALLPALGEELLFRGLLQQVFSKLFRSGHVAVVFTAILFSATHLQFYGFLPRLLLGLIYGYLFLWSGSLWLPILAHLVNNLIPVVVAHYIGWERLSNNVQEFIHGDGYSILIPLLLSGVLLFAVWDQAKNPSSSLQ